VLTIIAGSLMALVIQNAIVNAQAQQSGPACSVMTPCYVTNLGLTPLNVTTAHATSAPGDHIRGIPPNSGQLK
jgi:hypothetical protein